MLRPLYKEIHYTLYLCLLIYKLNIYNYMLNMLYINYILGNYIYQGSVSINKIYFYYLLSA